MTRPPVKGSPSGPAVDLYRAATAPILAAGGIAAAALVAEPRALLTAEPSMLAAGFVVVATVSSFAAGTLVRRYAFASAVASALASATAVWTLASRLADARTLGRFGEPLTDWTIAAAAIATAAAAFPAALAGAALRRRFGR